MNSKETVLERIERESKGLNLLDPEVVAQEEKEQIGYLIQLYKKMGRALTEEELIDLGNIL